MPEFSAQSMRIGERSRALLAHSGAGDGHVVSGTTGAHASANWIEEEVGMTRGPVVRMSLLMVLAFAGIVRGAETFSAVATVKTAGGTTSTTPVSITVDRVTPEREAETLVAAFKGSGVEGLRKALKGVPSTGSVTLGGGAPTPTRMTIERRTDKGRLLTIVTDTPLFFLGAGQPTAKPKAGYDFAVLDLEIESGGTGSGTLAPAARITVKQGAFVVDDYGAEAVRLTVKPAR
jgi:hypothetical protein